jgi:hypothetical protein
MEINGVRLDIHKACLRTPEKTQARQVSFFQGKRDASENHVEEMKKKIDSDTGQEMIKRLGLKKIYPLLKQVFRMGFFYSVVSRLTHIIGKLLLAAAPDREIRMILRVNRQQAEDQMTDYFRGLTNFSVIRSLSPIAM